MLLSFARLHRSAFRAFIFTGAALTIFAMSTRPARAVTVTNCYVATGAAAHVLCFLDLTGYAGTGTAAYQWRLPDGSILAGSLENPLATSVGPVAALPTYNGAVLGASAYTGVGGAPAIYGGNVNNNVPLEIGGLTLTSAAGTAATSIRMVGVDAETTDSGDGTAGNPGLNWFTFGTQWVTLQHTAITNQGCTIAIPGPAAPAGALAGSNTAECPIPANGPSSDIYLLSTDIPPGAAGNPPAPQIAMSYQTGTAKEGYAFAVNLATLTAKKVVNARVATADQFTVTIGQGATVSYTASTTGTGTTATTVAGVIVPNEAYTISETSSGNDLASYASAYACTNATAGSTTPLPAGKGTSFTVTSAPDDQITCTFTNSPFATLTKTVTNVTTPNGTTTADTAKPKDDLRYGITFTNSTGVAITGTTAHPIVLTDTAPALTTYAVTGGNVVTSCTVPAGLTCVVVQPTAANGQQLQFQVTGTLAVAAQIVATFDVIVN